MAKPPTGTARVRLTIIRHVRLAGTNINEKYKIGNAKMTASMAFLISKSPNNFPLSVKFAGMKYPLYSRKSPPFMVPTGTKKTTRNVSG